MGRRRTLVVVALVSLGATAAPAAASTRDRAAARSFATAADRLARDARATAPSALVAEQQEGLDCHLEGVRRARAAGAPVTAIIRTSLEGLALVRGLMYSPLVDDVEAFLRRIERVPTTDQVLVAGRAAWRETVRSMRVYLALPLPFDVCTRVNVWVRSGAAGAMFPEIDFARVNREMGSNAWISRESRIERAAERMRSLGQSRPRAVRFTVREALAQQIGVERRLVARYAPAG